jgi:hypothetical protein
VISTSRSVALVSVLWAGLAAAWLGAQARPAPAGVAADAMVAAQQFLGSLNEAQLARARFGFGDPIKSRWHNLPPTMQSRAGVGFADLTPAQRELGNAVLRSVLSPYGFAKVQGILSADQYFGDVMRNDPGGFPTGPNAYMLAIFGTPSATQPWAVQFNGHHLGVNVTIVGQNRVLAPTLTAAYPNMYQKDGKEIVVLAEEASRALKLIQSLDTAQKQKAILPNQIWDFLLGPGHDGEVIQPEGIRGSEMTAAQREMLLDVAAAWVNIVDDDTASAKMVEVRRGVADTYFLWSGDTTVLGKAYFRLQGPSILIEYSPQTLGGPGSVGFRGGGGGGRARGAGGPVAPDPNRQLDPTHVHAVYRDFTNDYGSRFLATR